jgi:hypothetical protein
MLKGYRTIVFNLIMMVIAALAMLLTPEQAAQLPDATAVNVALDHLDALLVFALGVGNLVLRRFTTTPIGKPE